MKPCIFAFTNPNLMKNSAISISIILFAAMLTIAACTKEKVADPCNGNGVLNIENKLDSTLSIKILETNNITSIDKDFTFPFTLPGNQPYTLSIDGPQYHKDTTVMILFCDNLLFIVKK